MDLTYATLSEMAKNRRSWVSTGTAFDARVRSCAALALQELASLCGEAIVNGEYHTRLIRTYRSGDPYTSSAIAATSDRMVLEITDSDGTTLPNSGWHPTVDGTWDALVWIEIQVSISNPDGSTYTQYERRQSLEWWSATDNDGTHYYVTIDRPWRNTTDTLLAYRLYQPYFWMNSAFIGLAHPYAARLFDPARFFVNEIAAADADFLRYMTSPYDVTGPPLQMWKDRSYTEQGFSTAPTVAVAMNGLASVPWTGPVQEGTFTFYATVVWGRTSQEWQDAPNLIRDPIFESSPSPVSASFSHTTNPGVAIRITTPNPDELRGFSVSSTLRYGHSGRRVRIYAARSAIRTAGLGTYNNVEADGIPYLIAEFDAYSTSPESSYIWNGTAIPEYTRRLPFHNTSQTGYRLYPLPDSEYLVDARIKWYPPELAGSGDVVPVHESATNLFLKLFEEQLCRIDGSDIATATVLHNEAVVAARVVRSQLQGIQRIQPTKYTIGQVPAVSIATYPINLRQS